MISTVELSEMFGTAAHLQVINPYLLAYAAIKKKAWMVLYHHYPLSSSSSSLSSLNKEQKVQFYSIPNKKKTIQEWFPIFCRSCTPVKFTALLHSLGICIYIKILNICVFENLSCTKVKIILKYRLPTWIQ